MKEKIHLNMISKAEDLRLYIIEHALHLEETISFSLGTILNIEWKESESFGFGSSSLTFSQKVRIIRDLKGIDKIGNEKLTAIMTIRNKFAHIFTVKSFQDFFNTGEGAKNVKKNLDIWYKNKLSNLELNDDEYKYKSYFFFLFIEVNLIIKKIIDNHITHEVQKNTEFEIHKFFSEILVEEIINLPDSNKIISNTIEKVREKMDDKIVT